MAVIPENPPLGDCKRFPLSAPTPFILLESDTKTKDLCSKKSRFYLSSFAFLKVTTNAPLICEDVAI